MSQFPDAFAAGSWILGGYGMSPYIGPGPGMGMPYGVVGADAPEPTKTVKPEERTQRPYLLPPSGWGTFPGFDPAPPGSVPIYWQMRRYPTICLAWMTVATPILAGTQTIEIAEWAQRKFGDDTMSEMRAAAEQYIAPIIKKAMTAALDYGLHFGFALQEIIWERTDDKLTIPSDIVPVLPGEGMIYRDIYRRFSGFRVYQEERDARYGFLFVNQPWIDPIFGYSRNENARVPWWRAMQSANNADRTEKKASGTQIGFGFPMGQTWTDDDGNPLMPADVVQQIFNGAIQGKSFTYPKVPFRMQDVMKNPALWDMSTIDWKTIDWGNMGPAIEAHLARKRELDVDMFRGWYRPERSAMEGVHGTLAEAQQHGEAAITDSELIHSEYCSQFDAQVTNRWLVTNFGKEFAGSIFNRASPLTDPVMSFMRNVANTLVSSYGASGPAAADMLSQIDWRRVAEKTELPLLDSERVSEIQEKQQQMMAAMGNGPPSRISNDNGGRDANGHKDNSNSNGKGKLKKK